MNRVGSHPQGNDSRPLSIGASILRMASCGYPRGGSIRRFEISLISLFVALVAATTPTPPSADDSKAEAKAEGKLVGTWKLVSKKNQEGKKVEIPQGTRVLKLLTPTHFIAVTHNADGEVSRVSGGELYAQG